MIQQEIYYDDRIVGQATYKVQGLYHEIRCRCKLDGKRIYRLELRFKDRVIPLGVCIPNADIYTLTKRIASKWMPESTGEVCVIDEIQDKRIPVESGCLIPDFADISTARVQRENDKVYLVFHAR